MIDFSTFNQIMSREVGKGTKDKFVRKQVAGKVDTTACVSALFLQKGHFCLKEEERSLMLWSPFSHFQSSQRRRRGFKCKNWVVTFWIVRRKGYTEQMK
jgi:hypothetical protein